MGRVSFTAGFFLVTILSAAAFATSPSASDQTCREAIGRARSQINGSDLTRANQTLQLIEQQRCRGTPEECNASARDRAEQITDARSKNQQGIAHRDLAEWTARLQTVIGCSS